MINILPPDVVAKIAAGEAVERPASVVKELLENAIDAGASSIEIHLKDAGRELIHIKDNGCGMARQDLERIFQRHATNKIGTIEDLEKLSSMGFRGEALYSIGAVSDVLLSSKVNGQEGWQIHWRGGRRQNLQPTALGTSGCDIKVRELFFNTPARRKFLKNNTSELNHIINIVLPYTLIYPDKRFLLTHGPHAGHSSLLAGRSLLDVRPAPSIVDRIAASLNLPMKHFIETDQEFVEEKIRVRLCLGNINIQRPRRDMQFLFVNNRPIESRNISFNINDVYKLILPPGVYATFIVNISLDSAHVDVNIHPTKREVRLKDEGRIISILRRMVEYQLMHKGQARELEEGIPINEMLFAPGQAQAAMSFPSHPASSLLSQASARVRHEDSTKTAAKAGSSTFGDDMPQDFQLFSTKNTLCSKLDRARFVGSFLQKFLLFEADQSLLIIDQHAAQERIMFEKFKNQIEKSQVETQPLLSPLLLKLTPQEKLAWQETQENLSAAGIATTLFDEDTLAIQSQPLLLKNIEHVVRTILAGDKGDRQDKDTLARRACKASIVAGDKIDVAQANWQRQELLACADPFTCPHGRPTVIELNQKFLDRQFLRT